MDVVCNDCGQIIPEKFRDYLIEIGMVVSKEDFEDLLDSQKDDAIKRQEIQIGELKKNKLALMKRMSKLENKLKEKYTEEYLTCQVCFSKFDNITGLRNHIRSKHRGG